MLNTSFVNETGSLVSNIDYDFVDKFAKIFDLSLDKTVMSTATDSASGLFNSLLSDAENARKVAESLSENNTALRELVGKDVDFTDLNKELEEYDVAVNKADEATKGFNSQLALVAQSNINYENLTEAQRQFLNDFVNGFEIDGSQLKDEDFVDSITNQVYNLVNKIKENPATQFYLQDLFNFETKSDTTPIDDFLKQYEEKVQKVVDSIPNLSKEEKVQITTQLMVKVKPDKKLKKEIQSKLEDSGFSQKDIEKLFSELSLSDLQILFTILSDPNSKYESIEDIVNAVDKAKSELQAKPVKITFGDTIEELDKVKASFDVLDKAFANLIDKDKTFGFEDLSSLYEQFKEVKGVNKYLRQMQEANGDAKQIQSAFNGLTTAYLNQSGILDTVTDKNADLVASMLKEMGVANASQIVNEALTNSYARVSAEKFLAKNASFDLMNATSAEIQTLVEEGVVSQDTAAYLAQLALQKQITNQTAIVTEGDIKNLESLANAAGMTMVSLQNLKSVSNAVASYQPPSLNNILNSSDSRKKAVDKAFGDAGMFSIGGSSKSTAKETANAQKQMQDALKKVQKEFNKQIQNAQKYTYTPVKYTGGSATNAARERNAKDKKKKKSGSTSEAQIQTIDWAANSINNLTKAYSKLEAELENINKIYGDSDKKLKQQTNKYNELIKASKGLEKAYNNEADAYLKSFNKIAKKIPAKYVEKIKSKSLFSTEDFTVKAKNSKKKDKTYENVTKAQEYYQNYLDARNKNLEQKNKTLQLLDDKTQAKIDRINNKIGVYEDKIENTSNYKEKIKLNNKLAKIKKNELELEKQLAKTSDERAKINEEIKKNSTERKETNVGFKTDDLNKRIEANEAMSENSVYYKTQIQYADKILSLNLERLKAEKSISKTTAERIKLEEEEKRLIAENAMKRLEIIQARYNNSSSLNTTKRDLYKNEISNIESQGYQVGKELYERIIGLAEFNNERLKRERDELVKQFEHDVAFGEIDAKSSEWYDGLNAINEINKAIQDGQVEIIEYNNALRQLSWDRFDLLLSKFEKLNEESNFLIDLLSNKKLVNEVPDVVIKADDLKGAGGLTDYGNATNALHLQNYDVYMAESDKLSKEIEKLNKQIAKGGGLADQNLINRRDELLSQQHEAILNAQAEKDAIVSLVTQGYEAQIEAMQKLTDLNKELLEKEQERNEYEKSINDKSKSITVLQKQIAALSLSTDRKDIAERLKLQEELVNQQKELDETQKEHSIETQKESLDDAMELYEQKVKEYLKNTDQVFTDTMNSVNKTSDKVMNTITSEAKKVGTTVSENMIKIWSDTSPITEYGSTLWNTVNGENGVLSAISSITNAWKEATKAYEDYAKQSANQSVSSRDEAEETQYGSIPSVEEILGKNTGSYKADGSTKLNQYITGLGYKKLSFEDMSKLGQALNIDGINSVSDVDMSNDKNAQNRDKILNELKELQIRNVIGKPNNKKIDKNSDEYKRLGKVNQHLVSQGYDALSKNKMLKLARALGLTGITADNLTKNSQKILTALTKAGFSKGGIVGDINRVIKSNGDDGIATVQRKELILTAEQAKRFINFFKAPSMSETVEKALNDLNASARNNRANVLQIMSPLVEINGDISTQQMFDNLQKQINDIPNTLIRQMNNARTW